MASPPVFAAEVEARGHREEVSASGGPAPDVPPTPTARTKSGGAQGRPRHTYRPRPRPEVLAAHSARGIPPDEAARRVYAYDLVAAWRRMRSARGDPAGRKPRIRGLLRTAMREQEAMRREYEAKRLREQREGGAVPELHDSR